MSDRNNTGDEGKQPREEIELTTSEKKVFETLPRDKMPNAALEDRVVGALQGRGVLEAPRGRVIVLNARRFAAVVAASVALLAGGFAMGQWAGGRQAQTDDIVTPEASDISIAATLQRTGSEYVLALERFAELPDSVNGDVAVQGREVALTTLYTAADQIARLVPKEELARQLLTAINARPSAGAPVEDTRIIEF